MTPQQQAAQDLADIWHDLKQGQRPDWSHWIERTATVAIGALLGAAAMWSWIQ